MASLDPTRPTPESDDEDLDHAVPLLDPSLPPGNKYLPHIGKKLQQKAAAEHPACPTVIVTASNRIHHHTPAMRTPQNRFKISK